MKIVTMMTRNGQVQQERNSIIWRSRSLLAYYTSGIETNARRFSFVL